jgi:DNA topoisomerase-1
MAAVIDDPVVCPVPGLRWVDDSEPGITRKVLDGHFAYYDAKGKRIRDEAEIARINALVIPPGYTDVWISSDPRGHIQATGRDARGRKQYRYHPDWHATRDADKYESLIAFAGVLPRIRRQVAKDLARQGLPREKVIAAIVSLLETTLIRIGSKKYAIANRSFGLTTLRTRHAKVMGQTVRFRFRGKSGVEHDVKISDRRLATIVRRCMEIPGQALFACVDGENGTPHAIDSGEVNDYLRAAADADITAKDYRTWAGSVMAFSALQSKIWADEATAKRTLVDVTREVASRLGNTPAVCRKCYIHPAIFAHYLEQALPGHSTPRGPRGLHADERRFLAFLNTVAEAGAKL